MRFLYHPDAGKETIVLSDASFRHAIAAHRRTVGDSLTLHNLREPIFSTYRITTLTKREAVLTLFSRNPHTPFKPPTPLIALAVIDPKEMKRSVRMLAELGQQTFVFVYTKRAQHSFPVHEEKLRSVVIQAYERSGATPGLPSFQVFADIDAWRAAFPDGATLSFGGTPYHRLPVAPSAILVGPEGGFTSEEEADMPHVGLNTDLTLSAPHAALACAAQVWLTK